VTMTEPGTGAVRGQASRHPLVRLVTRLVYAQTIAAAFVGVPFSRRQLSSILLTLAMVAVFLLVALMVRTGGRAAWLVAVCYESAFFVYGLSRFVTARYAGGTLFALVVAGTLVHPAVVRAYSAAPTRLRSQEPAGQSASSRP
jgi:O-antigen ligase